MKKSIFVLSVLFIIITLTCNLGIRQNEQYANLVLNLDGGQISRALNEELLPNISDSKIRVVIYNSSNEVVEDKTFEPNTVAPNELTFKLPVNLKVKIQASLITNTANWQGWATHTMKLGENSVNIKLQKTISEFLPILFSKIKTTSSAKNLELKYYDGTDLSLIENFRDFIFTRDHRGYLYLFNRSGISALENKSLVKTCENDEETDRAFKDLPLDEINTFTGLSRDIKTDKLYFVYLNTRGKKYEVARINTEKIGETLVTTISEDTIGMNPDLKFATVYDNTIYILSELLTGEIYLKAYPITEEENNFKWASNSPIETEVKNPMDTGSAISIDYKDFTDIYANENGVFLLFSKNYVNANEQGIHFDPNPAYSIGGVLQYKKTNSTLEFKKAYGFNSNPTIDNNMITTDENKELFGPIKFIGSKGNDTVYLADDGFKMEFRKNKTRLVKNIDRIVSFNTKTGDLSSEEAPHNTTWLTTWENVFIEPETPILLWQTKQDIDGSFRHCNFWHGETGKEEKPAAPFITDDKKIADFKYDDAGNLYFLDSEQNKIICYTFDAKTKTYNYDPPKEYSYDSDDVINNFTISPLGNDEKRTLYYLVLKPDTSGTSGTTSYDHVIKSLVLDNSTTPTPTATEFLRFSYEDNTLYLDAIAVDEHGFYTAIKKIDYSDRTYSTKIDKYDFDTNVSRTPVKSRTLTDKAKYSVDIKETIDNREFNGSKREEETIVDLLAKDGNLYILTKKEKNKELFDYSHSGGSFNDFGERTFSGTLHVISGTEDFESYTLAYTKDNYLPLNFIAIKPKELVIAVKSNIKGSVKLNGSSVEEKAISQKNTIQIFDLENLAEPKNEFETSAKFKTFGIDVSGQFTWY